MPRLALSDDDRVEVADLHADAAAHADIGIDDMQSGGVRR